MIQVENISKKYDEVEALKNFNIEINDQEVFGLVGTNGSGKTTLLRMISGIVRPDAGQIKIDDEEVYENEQIKKDIFFIPEDTYYYSNYTCDDMKNFYQAIYESFDEAMYNKLMLQFGLERQRKLHTFSKGMKKQFYILIGISANTRYLLLDETFDGLDPVMRQAVKSLLASEMCNRKFTPIIASHNLRELEDICERVGLMHNGEIIFAETMESLKENLHKVQCVFKNNNVEELFHTLEIAQSKKQGSVYVLTVRGDKKEIMDKIEKANPLFYEMIPLSLEEMFISETEVKGYEVKNKLF